MITAIDIALAMIRDSRKIIADYFSASVNHRVIDMTSEPWYKNSGEVSWWENSARREANPDDSEYSGTIYGTSAWTGPEFTMFVLNDGCGNRDAYIFRNSNKVEVP